MKNFYLLTFLLNFLFMPFVLTGQTTAKDLSVRVWAEPNEANGTIQLNWEDFGHANPITIYKKAIDSNAWITVTTLPDAAKSYTINAIYIIIIIS